MSEPYSVVKPDAPEPAFQLTVVTVCWNALADLKPTVESVLAQKAKGSISIEHLVVDGASTEARRSGWRNSWRPGTLSATFPSQTAGYTMP